MTDLSGITITTGILPAHTRENLAAAVERIGAKVVDGVRIDTTHFVTTEGRGLAWEKAVEMNIPVVRPEWVAACEESGRILGVTKFYLDALRPGPPTESSTPTTAPTPQQTQKELPTAPSSTQNGESQDATEKKKAGDDSSDEEDDTDEKDDEKNGIEDKVRAKSADEQKMRLEDKEEKKVALSPSEQATPAGDNTADDEKQPGLSPGGDGASFQDVAL